MATVAVLLGCLAAGPFTCCCWGIPEEEEEEEPEELENVEFCWPSASLQATPGSPFFLHSSFSSSSSSFHSVSGRGELLRDRFLLLLHPQETFFFFSYLLREKQKTISNMSGRFVVLFLSPAANNNNNQQHFFFTKTARA